MTALQIVRPGAVSGLGWTVLSGTRRDVMTALGAEHAEAIARWRATDSWRAMVGRAQSGRRAAFEAVVASSRRLLPVESDEIDWIAEGAGVPADELWALNLRGDLGRDGTGCSDLCTTAASRVLMGHNEDGDGLLAGLVRLVTLVIDGDPSMTVVWYPGMLPANSFVATSAGLVFGMDHVPVHRIDPGGAGRHLVARHAQRQADGGSARRALTGVPCAGGFAFDVADGPGGRADVIENAAGQVRTATAGTRPLRHTNHLRLFGDTDGSGHVPGGGAAAAATPLVDDRWTLESRTRLAALETASQSPDGPRDVLAALRAPGVLNRDEDLYTFTSAAVDPGDDVILLQGAGDPWTGGLRAFAAGRRETR